MQSVGFDLVYDESSLHEKEKSLLKSLEHLNCKLMKLNFSQGEHLQHCVEAIPKQSLSREADERNRVGHAQMHQTFGENHAADAQTRKNSSHPHRDKKSRFCIAETSSSNHHGRDRATQSALQTGTSCIIYRLLGCGKFFVRISIDE